MAEEEHDHFTYIVTVRETVDVQYKATTPHALTIDEIEELRKDLERDTTPAVDIDLIRMGFTANTRSRRVADVECIGWTVTPNGA